jgi:hypothetical protein
VTSAFEGEVLVLPILKKKEKVPGRTHVAVKRECPRGAATPDCIPSVYRSQGKEVRLKA